jgi:hypothetical protein
MADNVCASNPLAESRCDQLKSLAHAIDYWAARSPLASDARDRLNRRRQKSHRSYRPITLFAWLSKATPCGRLNLAWSNTAARQLHAFTSNGIQAAAKTYPNSSPIAVPSARRL